MSQKTNIQNFEKFLKTTYPKMNQKNQFKSTANYSSYLRRGLANIHRSEFHLHNAKTSDFHQWIARIGDLPAQTPKDKNYFDDQKVAMSAFLKFHKYNNGLIKIVN